MFSFFLFFSFRRHVGRPLRLHLKLSLSPYLSLLENEKRPKQARRCSTAAAPAAAAAAAISSVAAAAESVRAAVLSAVAAVLPSALTQQLAQLSPAASLALSAVAAVAAFLLVKKIFDTPSRKYDPANPNVGDEYDAWTR